MSGMHLSVTDVSWRPHKRSAPVLHATSFDVAKGHVLGVVGPNGAGKSTLLRLLYRFQAPTTGQVMVNGQDIWAIPARQAAQHVAAVLQEQAAAFGLNVREIISLGRTPHRRGYRSADPHDLAVIDRVMALLDLQGLSHRDFGTLSGGERQRVMVARALAQEPEILILDEPTNHLDIRHQLEVLALIRQLDLTIVVSLHDLNMAADICDNILVLEDGQPRGFGTPDSLLTEALVSNTFRVDARREKLAPSDTNHLSFHLPS
ncbi:iron complex transport system ATP-binding protein [Yoonia maricola]|uniref:Iron complex transport system ATP-binding protein n=1 Tax=Yoonia maricola TaxID=420999 RepID=A0A2M8WPL5_9RHOB|nr:ABC transporter ATP-binding protein [Yoonia maricola]PJI92844.1 iron complex transport system ATP-binding protein [Yoonia maricola]